jgi:hypothetical protein
MGAPLLPLGGTIRPAAGRARLLAACALAASVALHTCSAARGTIPGAALFEFDEVSQTLEARSMTLSVQGGTYLASTGGGEHDRLVAHTGLSAAVALRLGRDTVAALDTFNGHAGFLGGGAGAARSGLQSLKLACRLDQRTIATVGHLWGDVNATTIGVATGIPAGRAQIGGWLWTSVQTHARLAGPLASGYGLTASYRVMRGLETGFVVDGPLGSIDHTALQVDTSLWDGDASLLWHRYGTRTQLAELRFWRDLDEAHGIGLYFTDHVTAGLWTRWRH